MPATSAPAVAWYAFDALNARTLHDLLKLRSDVFVTEQACPFSEIDGRDPEAIHGVARLDGVLVATARLLETGDGEVKIGRVVTHPDCRGRGVGAALMRAALTEIARRWGPAQPVLVSAQTRVRDFYAGLGFAVTSGVYEEDGIPHVAMRRRAERAAGSA
jgi:ElaA protein